MSDFYTNQILSEMLTMEERIVKEMKRRNDLLEEIIEIMKEGKRDENIKGIDNSIRIDKEVLF